MSDLKKLIFKILEKVPTRVEFTPDKDWESISYIEEHNYYDIQIYKNNDAFKVDVCVSTGYNSIDFKTELTEKEYMQIKWQIEEWDTYLRNKAFDTLEEFALKTKGTIDDLLDD